MLVEIDSMSAGIDNSVGFLPSSCLKVDQLKQTSLLSMQQEKKIYDDQSTKCTSLVFALFYEHHLF